MVNLNINTMVNYANILGSSTRTPMLLPEYHDHWSDRVENYPSRYNEYLWRSINKGPYRPTFVETIRTTTQNESMIVMKIE